MLTSASEQEICAANVSSGCGSVEVNDLSTACWRLLPEGLPNSPQSPIDRDGHDEVGDEYDVPSGAAMSS